jgi:hypothetical protein
MLFTNAIAEMNALLSSLEPSPLAPNQRTLTDPS